MVRYVDFSSLEICTKFLGIVQVVGTPNASTIFEAIKVYIENDLRLTLKFLYVMTDGASVMQGSRNTVKPLILAYH